MKNLKMQLITLTICSLFFICVPTSSMAVDETSGTLNSRVDIRHDGTGFLFFLNTNSPCGEAGYFVPNSISNYSEIFSAVMDARNNTETVLVVTSGCWSVNPQFSKVYGISVGR